jgi:cyclopropane fatty-acyl-phospholipid synthase-like methyltransferase
MVASGVDCWGCDSSAQSVEATNALLGRPAHWHGAVPTSELSRFGADFDLVTCIETIEHVPTSAQRPFLARLRDVLAPGGRLFLTTPNEEDLASAETYCPFCDTAFHNMQHVQAFSATSLRSMLEANGFVAEEVGALDFGGLQSERRAWLDVSTRSVARAARNAAFRAFDRLSGRHFPSLFRVYFRNAKLPHLCAVARRA